MNWNLIERIAKLVGAVIAIGGIIVWVAGSARSSEVAVMKRDVAVLQEQHIDEREWRLYLAEQLKQIAITVRAPAIQAPIFPSPPPTQPNESR